MTNESKQKLLLRNPILNDIQNKNEILWVNRNRKEGLKRGSEEFSFSNDSYGLSLTDVEDAEARLLRFAPLIKKVFPETAEYDGIIESVLRTIPQMQELINLRCSVPGRLLIKQDSHLAIAGSIKARGGIYEVLCHTEELALAKGLLNLSDSYEKLADPVCKKFFSHYTIQVGSTGNLGLSIGIISTVIGFRVVVHMSADAKQWKKDLLRKYGVTVKEYDSDYSEAVRQGRLDANSDPSSYFVDDENSKNLFLGYAVAAKRLVHQLHDLNIPVDEEHPLFVYLPCGVGGAPGGITYGLKSIFGNSVHCFFVEPVGAPCMAVGMISGMNNKICVQDLGLTGETHADGLAVGRPSCFVGDIMRNMLDGIVTVKDAKLYDYMRDLLKTEEIFLEPSACAGFHGVTQFILTEEGRKYIEENALTEKMENACHIVWATGGGLVPEDVRMDMLNTYL